MSNHSDLCDQITIEVQSETADQYAKRLRVAEDVRDYFLQNLRVPDSRKVLCFLANHNAYQRGDPSQMGRYYPQMPQLSDGAIASVAKPFHDCLILLNESVWNSELGATMTLAHELQHFLQHSNEPELWAVDCLLQHLLQTEAYEQLKHGWKTPCDTEARVVALQVALNGSDRARVDKYVEERIHNATGSAGDIENWRRVQSIDPTTHSLARDTKSLIQRFMPLLKELQRRPDIAQLPCAKINLDRILASTL
jgi:hypothetical protein